LTHGDVVTLAHGEAVAEIALAGAEARVWRVKGRDLLWPGDPEVWREISPVLFPIVGWTRDGARVDGRRYALGCHGFAAGQGFGVETRSENSVRLTLRDNGATRDVYPFAFRLTLDYRLGASALEMAIEVENTGPAPMPYACGLHPGFRWPFADGPREGYRVLFEKPERPEVPVIAPGGLISSRTRALPIEGSTLDVADDLFSNEALCFIDPASRALRFVAPDGSAIALDLGGFAHFALWTRGGAPFLCLEAWTGYGDPEGFAGELKDKPGMRMLAGGATARHAAIFSYTPAPGKSS
jgi:galactose mutarotase-like enzyme